MKFYSKEKKLKRMLTKVQKASATKRSKSSDTKVEFIENKLQEISKLNSHTAIAEMTEIVESSNPETNSDQQVTLTDTLFSDLSLSEPFAKALQSLNFVSMTEIQKKAIPILLKHKDLMASAKTGSGKTLAFLIPILELMLKLGLQPRNGTGAIIISPTRELSLQTYGVLKELVQFTQLRIGLVIGGTNRAEEARNLSKGVTVLVATPGRLLDHLQTTENFLRHNLRALVIDEADRLLDIGFEEEMKQILRLLPRQRQTMLFSATLSEATRALASTALKSDCQRVGVDERASEATVAGLEQGYLVCPPDKRFPLLYTFLRKNKSKKIMVFMSSCMEVKFYADLFNFIDLPVLSIHGKQKQVKRTSTFFKFGQVESAILLCTDVAARGLDIPQVDWIFQYDPPDDPKEYIHRVGRTARAGARGKALLVLRPHELAFLSVLKKAKVKVVEFEVSADKLASGQEVLEQLVSENAYLHQSAEDAYKSLVRAYASHSLDCFSVHKLDCASVAKNFGLSSPPHLEGVGMNQKQATLHKTKSGGPRGKHRS